MSTVTILGAGVMGTAFAMPLIDNGHEVRLVGTHLDDAIITSLKARQRHPKLDEAITLSGLTPYYLTDLPEALEHTELVILGVNSLGIDWAAEVLRAHLTTPIILLTKGLAVHEGALEILPHTFARKLGRPAPLLAITGPCIAAELAARRHSSVVLAGDDPALLESTAQLLATGYYHVHTSRDLVGAEVCAAFKNLYALAIGTVQGALERTATPPTVKMHNHSAAMFSQALYEMQALTTYLGGNSATVTGLPGSGDLYVTCQSGRNGRMGRLLGLGLPYSQAKREHMPDDTVEGALLAMTIAPVIPQLLQTGKLKGSFPLLSCVLEAVCQDAPTTIAWEAFLQ
jgi:glycerol-3-phosphate dehydrogenase (NAD(P)+)